jgi:TRAP-type C4-dicarboxylate transport system substrate-binding protein
MKGLKIAGKGRIADILKSLGAAPVPLETGDYYESLKRGVVDGAASPINTLKDWKLGEVAKYSGGKEGQATLSGIMANQCRG